MPQELHQFNIPLPSGENTNLSVRIRYETLMIDRHDTRLISSDHSLPPYRSLFLPASLPPPYSSSFSPLTLSLLSLLLLLSPHHPYHVSFPPFIVTHARPLISLVIAGSQVYEREKIVAHVFPWPSDLQHSNKMRYSGEQFQIADIQITCSMVICTFMELYYSYR